MLKKRSLETVPEKLAWVILRIIQLTLLLEEESLREKALKLAREILREGKNGSDKDDKT